MGLWRLRSSKDLRSASWIPRKCIYIIASRHNTQEELMFQFEPESRKNPVSCLKAIRQEEFPLIWGKGILFFSCLQLIGCGPPTLGRAVCFTQSTDSNVNLIQKYSHRYNRYWPDIWTPPGLIKLTHKINYHNY